jgi:hypothetical protein
MATPLKPGELRSERRPKRRSWTKLSMLQQLARPVPESVLRAAGRAVAAAGLRVPISRREMAPPVLRSGF